MKTIITIFALGLSLGAWAQETTPVQEALTPREKQQIVCVIQQRPILDVFVWDVDAHYRQQLWLDKSEHMNIWINPEVKYIVSAELPFSQFLTTGAVYTFEHLRYTVRP
jgi:hypothetical protein